MNNKARTLNAMLNASMGIGTQFVVLISQFVMQTVFIKTLSAEYLGLNGVFSNVLQFLSIAELGIGGAITYTLYKPLADKNEGLIRSIMGLYKMIYTVIGGVILAVGLITSFFLNWFIEPSSSLGNIQFLFILYLLNSVVSYFFAYRRTLLIADQRGYVDSLNQSIFKIVQVVFQCIFLLTTHEYIWFLIIQIVATTCSNFNVYIKTNKIYPFLATRNESVPIPPEIVRTLKKNAVGAFSSKIGTIVMYGTSNILISKFIGLAAVGVYSNYMLLLNSVSTLMSKALSSVSATIANYVHSDDTHKTNKIFLEYMYVVNFCSLLCGSVLAVVLNPFIYFWVGEQYELQKITVSLLIFNWIINMMRSTALSFMTAYGTYWETRWKSLIESVVNLVIGVILISKTNLGVNSVIISSILVCLIINAWIEPVILFRKAKVIDGKKYVVRYFVYLVLALIISAMPMVIEIRINSNLFSIALYAGLSAIVFTILFVIGTNKFSESERFKQLVILKLKGKN